MYYIVIFKMVFLLGKVCQFTNWLNYSYNYNKDVLSTFCDVFTL